MLIRDYEATDLPELIDLTIEVFRPLFEHDLPATWEQEVVAHDHPAWEDNCRKEVSSLHDPAAGKFITLAEEAGTVLGYVGWDVSRGTRGQLERVAVRDNARGRGVKGRQALHASCGLAAGCTARACCLRLPGEIVASTPHRRAAPRFPSASSRKPAK